MSSPLPSRSAGVVRARTRQGYELPVIDVSHPSFHVPDDARSLSELQRTFADTERRRKRLPRFIMNWVLRSMARNSLLARDLFSGPAGFLNGMSTYMMKLGAANMVAPYDTVLDRRLAQSPGVGSMRLRLQQLAGLLAKALGSELQSHPGAPLHLVSLGGGTAIDSLNTLILLQKSDPAWLRDRPISLHVLDPDSEGPEFGERALAALLREGPLQGLAVDFEHTPYNWKEAASLASVVRELSASAANALIAVSTEGALFEYADDSTVLSNLEALREGGRVILVGGTVTRADPLTRELLTTSRFKLIPRGADRFGQLVRQARFEMTEVRSALLSDQVLLRPI